MAFNKIRGQQIKLGQITSDHIEGKLSESVLDIDFVSHSGEILSQKLVVDYVQKLGLTVNANSQGTTFDLAIAPAATVNDLGVILKTQRDYKVIVRNASTGEPLMDSLGREVFGYLTGFSEGTYTLTLNVKDEGTQNDVEYTATEEVDIDIVFPQRFTLQSVSEMFAANTKFVDGAADVTTHLNIDQITTDIFGEGYSLNTDGLSTDFFGNGKTLIEHIASETSGAVSGESAKNIIDEVVTGRGIKTSLHARFTDIETQIFANGPIDNRLVALENEITLARTNAVDTYDSIGDRLDYIEGQITNATDGILADLADESDVTKGAELVHVNASSDVIAEFALAEGNRTVGKVLDKLLEFTNTKVDAEETARVTALNALETKLASTVSGKGASLIGIEDADGNFNSTEKNLENISKELFEKIDSDISTEATARSNADVAIQNQVTANANSISDASGTKSTLVERLDVALKSDGTLRGLNHFHRHHKLTKVATAEASVIVFSFTGTDQFNTPKNGDIFDVSINGVEQYQTLHYTISIDGNDVTVTFTAGGGFFTDDVIELRATMYADTQPTT